MTYKLYLALSVAIRAIENLAGVAGAIAGRVVSTNILARGFKDMTYLRISV